MICRGCGAQASRVLCDLGAVPLANQLLTPGQLDRPEVRYPLVPMICESCQLVQLPELVAPGEIFDGAYPYFSSQSAAFVEHAGAYAAQAIDRFKLGPESLVVEIASNDGYLLQHFQAAGVRCYGVEPAQNVALHALRRGVPTLIEFFDANLVSGRLIDSDPGDGHITGGEADLIVANNVLAHVPKLDPFLHGVRLLLAPQGVLTIEVPWLCDLVTGVEVGTIYHEHYSYFLLGSLQAALERHGLRVFDVEHLDVHGGSLRAYVCHHDAQHPLHESVTALEDFERDWLLTDPLCTFAGRATELKRSVWRFLAGEHALGHTVAGYCAAAKGATVLAWCGVGADQLPFVADTTPAKQGMLLAGSRIPIVSPERLAEARPQTIWILAPNWAPDIAPRLLAQCPWRPEIVWQEGDQLTRVGLRASHARAA